MVVMLLWQNGLYGIVATKVICTPMSIDLYGNVATMVIVLVKWFDRNMTTFIMLLL